MDPIKAAKQKAAKKWAKLDSQTVPLYENISNGKATEADLKKLSKLYNEQSKIASETFEEALKAARESARQSVRKSIKSTAKAKQLLSTPELKRLLETTAIIVLQKSASLIKTAVDEALDGTIDRVERLIRDVRRMQVKNDEVLVRLRQQANNPYAGFFSGSSAPASGLKTQVNQAAVAAAATRQDKRFWLASLLFGKKEPDQSNVIDTPEKLVDAISNKVISSITVLDRFNAKAQDDFYSKVLSALEQSSFGSAHRYPMSGGSTPFNRVSRFRNRSSAEEFLQKAIDYLSDNKRKVSDYIFNKDSFAYKSFISLLNSEADIRSEYTVRTAEQINNMDKLTEAVYDYQKLDKDYRDDELEQARHEEANFGDKVFSALSKALSNERLLGKSFFKTAQEKFIEAVAKNTYQDVDSVRENIYGLEQKLTDEKTNNRFSRKAYERYRSIVFRELKRQWTVAAKDKLSFIRRKIRRQTNRVAKIFKYFTLAYLASVVINSLNKFIPNWKSDLFDWVTGTGADYLKQSGEQVGSLLGKAVTSTLKFIWKHKEEIFDFLFGVIKGMMKSIVQAGLSLFGIDYDKVFGSTPLEERQAKIESSGAEGVKARGENQEAFLASDAAKKITQKYGLSDNQAKFLLGGTTLDDTYEINGNNANEIAAALRDAKTKWDVDRAKAEEEARKAAEANKPSLKDKVKNTLAKGAEKAKAAVEPLANKGEQVAGSTIDSTKSAANTAYENVVMPLSQTANNTFNNAANMAGSTINNLAPKISPSFATENINQVSPFQPGASSSLIGAFNDAKQGASKALGQYVNTNVLETAPVKKTADTLTKFGSAASQILNGSVNAIPTFSDDGLFVQNAGLMAEPV